MSNNRAFFYFLRKNSKSAFLTRFLLLTIYCVKRGGNIKTGLGFTSERSERLPVVVKKSPEGLVS